MPSRGTTKLLSFQGPEHGWLIATLSFGDNEHVCDASDVPMDSLAGLTLAMVAVQRGETTTVEWHLEPEYEVWTFTPSGESMTLTVQRGVTTKFECTGARHRLCSDIVQALSALERAPVWTEDSNVIHWSHPFPTADLNIVRETLSRAN